MAGCFALSRGQPDYIRVHKTVYENIDSRRIYSILQDTPHWTRFIDFIVSKHQVPSFPCLTFLCHRFF